MTRGVSVFVPRMNGSIRAKILAGYALAIVFLLVLGVGAYLNVGQLVETARQQDETRRILGHIESAQLALTQAETRSRGFVLSGDESYLIGFTELRGQVEADLAEAAALLVAEPAQLERITRLKPVVEAKLVQVEEMVALRRAEGFEAAHARFQLGRGKELMNQVHTLKNELRDVELALLRQRSEAADRMVKTFYTRLVAGVLIAALVMFFAGRAIAGGIARPLGVLTRAAERIAAGDPEVELPETDRKDEVGRLNASFRRMGGVLSGMSAVNTRIAQGDLTAVVTPQSAADKFGTAHLEMIQSLSRLVGSVQRAGLQVNTSATEIAATSKQQQATANEIAATTTEIGATSRQIAATAKELVRSVGEVSGVAEETSRLAGSGQAGLGRMETTMRTIMDASSGISGKLTVLNEKASNINTVVTTITKVADQTNLLSLNAAIEAEKAGEYGLGFAVVATEIRRLADQTAVATFDIEQMVKEMQSAVSAGVMGMDKFSEEVRRGVEEVRQVGAQLALIIQQVQSLVPRFETVNEGMQSQAIGAQQINEALAQLSEAAQQTAESLRNSSLAIEQLNDSARELQGGVARFKLRA